MPERAYHLEIRLSEWRVPEWECKAQVALWYCRQATVQRRAAAPCALGYHGAEATPEPREVPGRSGRHRAWCHEHRRAVRTLQPCLNRAAAPGHPAAVGATGQARPCLVPSAGLMPAAEPCLPPPAARPQLRPLASSLSRVVPVPYPPRPGYRARSGRSPPVPAPTGSRPMEGVGGDPGPAHPRRTLRPARAPAWGRREQAHRAAVRDHPRTI